MQTMINSYPTHQLASAGQSPWLDYLSRDMLKSGKLKSLIQKGVLGLTSNPSIFQKAITQSDGAYEADIRKMAKSGLSVLDIYDELTVADIQSACDLFLPIYKQSKSQHGFVSLEVLPNLAYNTDVTLREAKRLYKKVSRLNVMIKIPATREGIPAVRDAIAEGINVNITLMFSVEHYRQVAWAYIEGLERLKKSGGDLSKVRSVASVFVSRIDTFIDKKIDGLIQSTQDSAVKTQLSELKGKAAVANSKQIYQEFLTIFSSERFKKLEKFGAAKQKVLWGSTSSKNPSYRDLIYVDTLVGQDTVNTMPQETLDAVLDHGVITPNTVVQDLQDTKRTLIQLERAGFDLVQIGAELQTVGVKLFQESFESLMQSLEAARRRFAAVPPKQLAVDRYYFSKEFQQLISQNIEIYQSKNIPARLINQEPTLWKNEEIHIKSISNRLGWLQIHEGIQGKLYELDQLAAEVKADGIKDVVLLGMGGSSLSPEVMSLICDRPVKSSSVRFRILDSTDPDTISKCDAGIKLNKTVFIVASKSGSTIETQSQYRYYMDRIRKHYGAKASAHQTGRHFIAITDQGSMLENIAKEQKFRRCFINPSNIGWRYSALSLFGMVPAALMGISFRDLLQGASAAYEQAAGNADLKKNAAVWLGLVMGISAKAGRDKLSFIMSKSVVSFGSWLEQLIAESTGKEKTGVLPVDTETFKSVEELAQDRLFVAIKMKKDNDSGWNRNVQAVRKAGFPLVVIEWTDWRTLGAEFLRWEIATAVACIPFGTNPFDELNVTESKEITGKILEELKTNPSGAFQTKSVKASQADLDSFLKPIRSGKDFAVILAYMDRNQKTEAAFQKIRNKIRKKYRVPVLFGFGPRYLHSIGQFYKGGTPTGYFIEFTKKDKTNVRVPGAHYTFGQLLKSQALGDYKAIGQKGLPIQLIDLGQDILKSLKQIEAKI